MINPEEITRCELVEEHTISAARRIVGIDGYAYWKGRCKYCDIEIIKKEAQ